MFDKGQAKEALENWHEFAHGALANGALAIGRLVSGRPGRIHGKAPSTGSLEHPHSDVAEEEIRLGCLAPIGKSSRSLALLG